MSAAGRLIRRLIVSSGDGWLSDCPIRCRLLDHLWGPEYPLLDGTLARKCGRTWRGHAACGWHQIPSKKGSK